MLSFNGRTEAGSYTEGRILTGLDVAMRWEILTPSRSECQWICFLVHSRYRQVHERNDLKRSSGFRSGISSLRTRIVIAPSTDEMSSLASKSSRNASRIIDTREKYNHQETHYDEHYVPNLDHCENLRGSVRCTIELFAALSCICAQRRFKV